MRDILFGTVWRRMIVLKLVIIAVMMVYKTQHYPYMGYQHLLVDYHFGFIKRALIGQLWSFVFPKVPVWAVFATGGLAILIALALYLAAFRKTFGFDERHLPLFVFTACSPMFFGNYIQTIGYYDIYGCIAALILLLMPSRSFVYVAIAALLSMVLILIHHIQTLMYVPTLVCIVGARYYLAQPRSRFEYVFGLLAIVPVLALFAFAQFVATASVPMAEFHAHMLSRMAGPGSPPVDPLIWYQSAQSEFVRTWEMIGKNAARIPVYVLILAAHVPLIVYFRRLVAALERPLHRKLVWLAVAGVSLGYAMIFIAVSDWARWFANWGVCMMMLMFAIRSLPAQPVAPIPDDKVNRRYGWVVAVLPRIGSTIPF